MLTRPSDILLLQDCVRHRKNAILEEVNDGTMESAAGYNLFLRLDHLLDKLEETKQELFKGWK